MAKLRNKNSKKRKRIRRYVLAKYGSICQICQYDIDLTLTEHPKEFTLGHIVPAVKGGKYVGDNLRPEHRDCNEFKARWGLE